MNKEKVLELADIMRRLSVGHDQEGTRGDGAGGGSLRLAKSRGKK